MPVERREDFNIAISRDTGLASIQPTISTTERRPEHLAHNRHDLIRSIENTKIKEQAKAAGFTGVSVALVIGGIDNIIKGVDSQDPEQVLIGASAFVLARYILGSARNSFYESNFLSRQITKIKRTK